MLPYRGPLVAPWPIEVSRQVIKADTCSPDLLVLFNEMRFHLDSRWFNATQRAAGQGLFAGVTRAGFLLELRKDGGGKLRGLVSGVGPAGIAAWRYAAEQVVGEAFPKDVPIEEKKLHVEGMIAYRTLIPGLTVHDEPPADANEDLRVTDDMMAQTNAVIMLRFPVEDAEHAAKLIAAAEVLGVACRYVSEASEEVYGLVTWTIAGKVQPPQYDMLVYQSPT